MKLSPALLAVALFACTTDVPEESTVTSAMRCPIWGCGTNSATVGDGLIFDELDTNGSPNRYGMKIVSVAMADNTPVQLFVFGHWMFAHTLDWMNFYSGQQLVWMTITLEKDSALYEIQVVGVNEQDLDYWAGIDEPVPAYDLRARSVITGKFEEYVCKHEVLAPDPHWTGVEHHALVFNGDRYDPELKLVTETSLFDSWFNLACAATAPANMHLLRHTLPGGFTASGEPYHTTVPERQAMLKMFTADYCGTGESFTIDGVPLFYTDSNGWYVPPGVPGTDESIWNENGATCLTQPRHSSKYEVEKACGFSLPDCVIGDFPGSGHVFSAL
jgi:hypothetical protein